MYVCEPVLRMIEPVQCLWTCVMYMSHCYVHEPLLCLWTSVMDMKQCYLCEKVLCIWTSAIFVNQCYVWAIAMFVNPCFSCEPGLHLPLMMTVWFSKCLAASQAVFRHWETQLNHLVPSKAENQEISCTAKSFPESDREKNKMSKFFEKGNFFRRILGLKSFGHTGYMSTFEILE